MRMGTFIQTEIDVRSQEYEFKGNEMDKRAG